MWPQNKNVEACLAEWFVPQAPDVWGSSLTLSISLGTAVIPRRNWKWLSCTFNPLSPDSDQHQFPPNIIHTFSRDKVRRIHKMISKEKRPWSFIKFSPLILKGNVCRSLWRICTCILELKGLSKVHYRSMWKWWIKGSSLQLLANVFQIWFTVHDM